MHNQGEITKKSVEKKKIVIVGSGFVGKAAGKGFLELGHDVSFVDINNIVIEQLNKEGLVSCNFEAQCATGGDLYMVNVLTPNYNDHIDFRFIESAMVSLGEILKRSTNWPLIVIRSTVPPGATRERFLPILEQYSGKQAGKDFGIAMNPEFLREVTAEKDFKHPWIIVIGSDDPRSASFLEQLYQPFDAPIHLVSIKEAEMMKYVHNLYNAAKISFFNEMRMIAETAGVDADTIFPLVVKSAEASWNHTYGIKNMGPYDGSCLPKDTRAFLTWASQQHQKKLPLLHAVIKVNEHLKDKRYLDY